MPLICLVNKKDDAYHALQGNQDDGFMDHECAICKCHSSIAYCKFRNSKREKCIDCCLKDPERIPSAIVQKSSRYRQLLSLADRLRSRLAKLAKRAQEVAAETMQGGCSFQHLGSAAKGAKHQGLFANCSSN